MSATRSSPTRRQVLASMSVVAGSAVMAPGLRIARAAVGELGIIPLTNRLSMITGAGANVTVLETDEGLALVDSGSPARSDELLGFIDEAFEGAPIRLLFNTNWRPDHTGANEAIARRGATLVAHENTRLWMATEYYVESESKNYPPRPEAALPTDTFYSSDPQPLLKELGGYRIEYGHLPEAHTDGDIYVRFPEDDVIAVGDVVAVDAFPMLDYSTGGWIGGNQAAMQQLMDVTDASTRIVAGEGPPQTRDTLEAQLAMLDELRERIRQRILAGKGVSEIIAENPVIMDGYESLPDPEQFVRNVYNGLWWGGRLRGAY